MKKITIFLFAFFMVFAFDGWGQIISQYIETNSGTTPKGIEIWNNTGSPLNFLSNTLMIKKGVNGAPPTSDFTLSTGTLASGDVIVIGTSDLEATTTGNGSVFHQEGFTFNGNDALEVWYGSTKTDVFGKPGVDPGTEWSGSGVSTKNQNIQLKYGITNGDIDGWTDPSGRFETVSTNPVGAGGQFGFGIAPITGLWKTNAASTDWATGSNWDDGNVPSSGTVSIPAGATNYPTVTSSATCNNIIIESGASLIGSEWLTVNRTSTMQRAIDSYTLATNGWHLLASPVDNFTIAGSDFEPGTLTPNLDDFYAWSESGWEWLNYKVGGNNITNFVNGTGYLVSYETTATKDFSGTFNNADVTHPDLSLTSGKGEGWHLLGNPFQSALQWTNHADWEKSNIGAGAKIMNSGGSYTDLTVGGTDIIPANQGFFIEVTEHADNKITIPKSQRVHNTTSFYKNEISNLLTLRASDGDFFQETWIQFIEGSTEGYDNNYDVRFLSSMFDAPQLYSIVGEDNLSTNRIPEPDNENIISLGFKSQTETNISIQATGVESFAEYIKILLEDLQENTFVDLRKNSVYSFESKPEYNTERFRVHFKSTTGINDNEKNIFNIFSFNSNIYITNTIFAGANVVVYNIMGQEIENMKLNGDEFNSFHLDVQQGYYIVKVISDQFISTEKVYLK